MNVPQVSRGRLVELPEDECWKLAATRPVGRIAWRGNHGVTVLPVNFVIDGRDVLVRTTPYSVMARDCIDRDVAFEVDDIDVEHHTGWSVLLRGRSVREPRAGDEPAPWVTGPRLLGVRIEVREITGRRVGSA